MGRQLASLAEIVDRPDDSLPEMMLPDAVHHHARGQRVFPVYHPIGELQPAAALAHCSLLLPGNDLEKAPGSHFTKIRVVAANMHPHIMRVLIRSSHGED